MSGEVMQIVVDPEMALKTAGGIFVFCCFLIVLLFKVVLNGLNKTITNCHESLVTEHDHLGEKHKNHENRISNIEKAVFKPIGGINSDH